MKIYLTLIILNQAIFSHFLAEQINVVKYYGAQVGIDFEITVKRVRDRKCNKLRKVDSLEQYLTCLERRYAKRLKPSHLTHFITHSTRAGVNFGYSRYCSHKTGAKKRASVSTYNVFSRLYSHVAIAHEIFHQLCASHDNQSDNIMHEHAGRLSSTLPGVSEQTKEEILSGL